MKLNKNKWHAKLYRAFWKTKDMPNNLCNYFWELVFALVFTIPAWQVYIPLFKKEPKKDVFKLTTLFTILNGFMFIIGGVFTGKKAEVVFYYPIGLIAICLIGSVIIGFILALEKVGDYFGNLKHRQVQSKPSLLKTRWRDFKEKNCTLLDWEDNNKS